MNRFNLQVSLMLVVCILITTVSPQLVVAESEKILLGSVNGEKVYLEGEYLEEFKFLEENARNEYSYHNNYLLKGITEEDIKESIGENLKLGFNEYRAILLLKELIGQDLLEGKAIKNKDMRTIEEFISERLEKDINNIGEKELKEYKDRNKEKLVNYKGRELRFYSLEDANTIYEKLQDEDIRKIVFATREMEGDSYLENHLQLAREHEIFEEIGGHGMGGLSVCEKDLEINELLGEFNFLRYSDPNMKRNLEVLSKMKEGETTRPIKSREKDISFQVEPVYHILYLEEMEELEDGDIKYKMVLESMMMELKELIDASKIELEDYKLSEDEIFIDLSKASGEKIARVDGEDIFYNQTDLESFENVKRNYSEEELKEHMDFVRDEKILASLVRKSLDEEDLINKNLLKILREDDFLNEYIKMEREKFQVRDQVFKEYVEKNKDDLVRYGFMGFRLESKEKLEEIYDLFSKDDLGWKFARLLKGKSKKEDGISEEDIKTLKEIPDSGPIMGSSYVDYMKRELNLNLIHKNPIFKQTIEETFKKFEGMEPGETSKLDGGLEIIIFEERNDNIEEIREEIEGLIFQENLNDKLKSLWDKADIIKY